MTIDIVYHFILEVTNRRNTTNDLNYMIADNGIFMVLLANLLKEIKVCEEVCVILF